MRQFMLSFILLLLMALGNGAISNDTFELPRHNAPVPVFKTEEVSISGQKGYRILTDRYDITVFRADDGILAGQQLEHLAAAWNLLFAELNIKTLNIKEGESASQRHRVTLYRDKQEYIARLRRFEPAIDQTNGFYSAPKKTAYFFSTETKILFHEGTHQILAEHFFHNNPPAFRNNFWAVEGMALFMETLKIEEKSYKIGDILANRLYSAKVYRFERNHHLPIRKLTAMSAADIQTNADLQQIYSQSAALTHWLMFAEKGRYRSAWFELLRLTYRDSAKPETLSELTGLSYEELDAKYAEFLETIPE